MNDKPYQGVTTVHELADAVQAHWEQYAEKGYSVREGDKYRTRDGILLQFKKNPDVVFAMQFESHDEDENRTDISTHRFRFDDNGNVITHKTK